VIGVALVYSPTLRMAQNILILTAGYGEGHNTAARNIRASVEMISDGGTKACVMDLFETCYGGLNDVVKKAYLVAIDHAPKVWQKFYELLDSTQVFEQSLGSLAKVRGALEQILDKEKPSAVVSTYPVYNYLLDQIYEGRSARPFAQITVVTDSITVNSIWHRCSSDMFIVANEQTAAVMRQARVPAEKITVLGFPVAPCFSTGALPRKPPSETDGRRVLYMINAGKDQAPAIVRQLLELRGVKLTATVGRDEKLRARVERAAGESGRGAEIHGWTDKMPELLMTHHLLIGKAGGATVQETIAAKTPMIISRVVPGQEEGNARLLIGNQCGEFAATCGEIVRAVDRAFANDAALWKTWFGNISKLSRPDAALAIARYVLGVCKPQQK
jgi:UDP-N-acetylglucosamine:LPS N-acetylglucosamine transferase